MKLEVSGVLRKAPYRLHPQEEQKKFDARSSVVKIRCSIFHVRIRCSKFDIQGSMFDVRSASDDVECRSSTFEV